MIWSDKVREFGTSSGRRIAVNMAGEAWCLRNASGAVLRRAAQAVCSSEASNACSSWRERCLDVPDTGDPDDAVHWLTGCLNMPAKTIVPFSRPMKLLEALRLEGALLWPAAIRWMPHPCDLAHPSRTFLLKGGLTAFEKTFLCPPFTHTRRLASAFLVACSPMASLEDLSEEALLAVLEAAARSSLRPANTVTAFLAIPRRVEGMRRSDETVISVVAAAESLLHDLGVRGTVAPRYGEAAKKPGAAIWVAWFDVLSAATKLKVGSDQDAAYRRWLEYLGGFGTIPAPAAVRRDSHLDGPRGFLAWIQKFHAAESAQYKSYLQFLRQLFDALCDEGEMPANLLRDCDVPRSRARNNKTNKAIIPRELSSIVVEVVSELVELAFRQFQALSDGRSWAPAAHTHGSAGWDDAGLLPPTLLRPAPFQQLAVTLRGSDQSVVRVLNPVLPVLILWLSKVPNRSIEARMADSGEADELLPDVRLEKTIDGLDRVRATFRPNAHPLAERKRRQGAIRLIREGDREVVGLYATINKSQAGGHKDGADRGRELPWEDAQLHMALYRTRLWQEAINPVDRLLSRDQLRSRRMHPSDGLRGTMAGYTYLFRHLRDKDLSGRLQPVTYSRLHYFLMNVLDEAEARMAERGRQTSPPDEPGSAPRIVLARDEEGRATRCAYSLHCMRVTGLNALVEAGVPLWIISKFVAGHLSLVMTLYYVHTAPGGVIDSLAAAQRAMESGASGRAALEASNWTEEEAAGRLVCDGPVAAGNGNQIPGFWRAAADGVCPNGATMCHVGGAVTEGTTACGPVEGGAQNCALCRFFITGPRFIPGQVAWINATLYKARRQALGLQALWIERRAPGNARRRTWCDDRIARAEAEIGLTIRAVAARVRRLEKSIALARLDETGQARKGGTPAEGDLLITRMTPGDVRASLREASKLGFLDEVARTAALIPELDIPEAQLERGVLLDRLLDRDGFDAFLYRLPEALARAAGDAFVDGVRSLAPPGVEPHRFLDDVAEGRSRLFELDMRAVAAEVSRAVGQPIRIDLVPHRGARDDLLLARPEAPEPSA